MEFFIFIVVLAICVYFMLSGTNYKNQVEFIKSYEFPDSVKYKLMSSYPRLSDKDVNMIFDGLRMYFGICKAVGEKPLSMPSQAVDVAWHEFILNTLEYKRFCDKAFGKFLHHTPSEAMKTKTTAQYGIRRIWKMSCHVDEIDPRFPNKLPLLFSIDSELNIEDGYKYVLHCESENGEVFCVSHIGCEGFGIEERADIAGDV